MDMKIKNGKRITSLLAAMIAVSVTLSAGFAAFALWVKYGKSAGNSISIGEAVEVSVTGEGSSSVVFDDVFLSGPDACVERKIVVSTTSPTPLDFQLYVSKLTIKYRETGAPYGYMDVLSVNDLYFKTAPDASGQAGTWSSPKVFKQDAVLVAGASVVSGQGNEYVLWVMIGIGTHATIQLANHAVEFTIAGSLPEIDPAAEIAEVMLNSYADEDVSKTLTADSQYVYDGCEVGVKVRYTGNDGLRNFGSFMDARGYFSVTDWSDAAIRFYAYNPGVTDLTVYFMWTADGTAWHGADHDSSPAGIVLKGGEWTTVTWSLNDLGITTDFLANTEAKFWLKIGNAGPWEFYMCGMDIIDYDSAANGIANALLKSWSDDDVSRTLTADPQYLYDGCGVGVSVGYTGNDGLRNFGSFRDARTYFSVTDWGDAAIRFYAYNPGETDLTVHLGWTADGNEWHGADYSGLPAGIYLKGGEWTTVTWSLNDLEITTDFLANTNANFMLKIGNAGPWEFYMCGMDIINAE